MNPGSDIDIQLVAADLNRLRTAAALVKQRLREYAGVYEVSDSFRAGKEQFALLAVPLKSYLQPFIIMSAVPFGLIGAVWGHILLDLNLSMMSLFGLLALTGIVVNDSLIFVDFINRARSEHTEVGRMARGAGGGPADWRRFDSLGLHLAVREAGVIRFRPILLTSLTTFAGLALRICSRPSSP